MGDNNINTKDFVIGTLIGSIVGASAALLFAPKSGKELRGNINQGATQVKHRANDWKDIAQEKGSDWKDKAYTTGSEFKRRAMDSTSELTKNVTQKTKDLTSKIQEKQKKIEEADEVEVDEVSAETPAEEANELEESKK